MACKKFYDPSFTSQDRCVIGFPCASRLELKKTSTCSQDDADTDIWMVHCQYSHSLAGFFIVFIHVNDDLYVIRLSVTSNLSSNIVATSGFFGQLLHAPHILSDSRSELALMSKENYKALLYLGLNTGMGKPTVFPKQVSQVRVQFWFLAHCDTPRTRAAV
jgi:hypothetical protein